MSILQIGVKLPVIDNYNGLGVNKLNRGTTWPMARTTRLRTLSCWQTTSRGRCGERGDKAVNEWIIGAMLLMAVLFLLIFIGAGR